MEIIDNLKIQDCGRPPWWFLAFALYSRNYRKSYFEENKLKLVITAGNKSYWQLKKINMAVGSHIGFWTEWRWRGGVRGKGSNRAYLHEMWRGRRMDRVLTNREWPRNQEKKWLDDKDAVEMEGGSGMDGELREERRQGVGNGRDGRGLKWREWWMIVAGRAGRGRDQFRIKGCWGP